MIVAMCRGKLSAVNVLVSVKQVGSGGDELKRYPPPFLAGL